MLRSDAQVALSELSRVARQLADDYDHARGLAASSGTRALFASLRDARRALARRATDELAALGDVPNEPDPDRIDLSRATRRVKAALAADERRRLAAERERGEIELERAIERARDAEDLPQRARAWLEREHDDAADARRRLAELSGGAR